MRIGRWGMVSLLALGLALPVAAQTGDAAARREAMLARARAAELPGQWTPAPGDPLSHFTAGYAKQMCSAVFISGMDPAFAKGTLGDSNALAAVAHRMKAGEPVIDRAKKEVRITTKDGLTRIARLAGDQGCVPISEGESGFRFTPKAVARALPPAATTSWPMGNQADTRPLPPGLDAAKLKEAVDAAFAPDDALTQAYVVTWKGRIVAERYGPEADADTPLEGWSMGKSVAATLLGILMQQGVYTLDQQAPIPEWQAAGDSRQAIRIRDILQMSSGLRIRAEQDPEYGYDGRYPDHWYYYTGPDAFRWAATRPLQWKPGTIGRYRNTDPVLTNYLVKLGAQKLGQDYLSFPQRALFDRIGVRSAVLETDTHGNFLTQGAELMTARDWARLGQLYLQDGVWNGERLLPEGFAKFVGTVAPAWAADNRPIYGGLFWVNGDKTFPTPEDTYYMAGAGGQWTIIIPSHELVVVRLGRYAGERVARENIRRSLGLLMQAVPPSK